MLTVGIVVVLAVPWSVLIWRRRRHVDTLAEFDRGLRALATVNRKRR